MSRNPTGAFNTRWRGKRGIPDDLQKTLVEVRLLPVGSKLFWTHDRIEKFIQDTAEQSKQQVKPEGKPEEIDFSRYIKDWAAKYGFNAQQAREEIDKWIADIEKNQNDLYKLGLAALRRKISVRRACYSMNLPS